MMMETATWEEANEAVNKRRKYAPGQRENVEDFRREHEQRQNLDLRLHNFTMHNLGMKSVAPEGRSDALISVSLGAGIWHILTVDMSLLRLLLLATQPSL